MLKKLFEEKFNNKEEIQRELRKIFNFSKASKEEVCKWPYKSILSTSMNNVIDKEIFEDDFFEGVVIKVTYSKFGGGLRFVTDKGKILSCTGTKIKIFNPIYNEYELIELHPTRKGKNFWSLGYIIKEKDYKSLFYKTKEYKDKIVNFYEDKYGKGVKHQSQVEEVKNKIKNTIKVKYGVDWFLCRGKHYSIIEDIMMERFGVDNLFKSEEWKKDHGVNSKSTSKIEIKIIKELLECINFVEPYYHDDKNKQAIIKTDIEGRSYYFLDFYDKHYNIVIEIFGDFWHCNPLKYSKEYYHKIKNKTALEIWEEDRKRQQDIINILNADFFIIWEGEWDKNKEIIKKNILELINKKDGNNM